MKKKLLVQSIFGLLCGAILMYLLYLGVNKEIIAKFSPHGRTEKFVYFMSILFTPFIVIALHEGGHVIAGLLQGFKLEIYIVGFLGIKRENNKLKFFINRDAYFFGGIAATMPIRKYNDLRKNFATIVIAGPIFSFLSGILFLLIFSYTNSVFNSFWAFCGIFSFAIFLGTILPSKTGVFFSDRKRFQRLMDKGATGDVELALLETMNNSIIEHNNKNLSLSKIQLIKSDQDKFIQFLGNFYEYQYYKENEISDKAETSRNNLYDYKEHIPKNIWKSLNIDK